MKRSFIFTAVCASLLSVFSAKAQTNLQILYDFGSDRQHVTTTFEGFYNDPWGNTYFFIDHDFDSRDRNGYVEAPSGSYMEIARCLNFWQNSFLAPVSLHVEYNGGVYKGYTINNAFLAGVDFALHSEDYRYTLNIKALYKYITYSDPDFYSQLPLQFTLVWGARDLFGLKGLSFSGFADFWWEEHLLFYDRYGEMLPETSQIVFTAEPQLWYNVGNLFGCGNLNIGGEVELSYDFATTKGFRCRPCAGLKWVF